MSDETPKLKVTMIPAARQSLKKVAIYCHVSTTHEYFIRRTSEPAKRIMIF